MPIVEDAKRALECLTGLGRPRASDLRDLTRPRKPKLFRFEDDGETPNNPQLPLILYRTPVRRPRGLDPAAVFEELFASNGWTRSWRDGMYDFIHFHTRTHEVLGIARGMVRARFGGGGGGLVELGTGDVVIIPAGTGHRRLRSSSDLLVVGAYPRFGKYDEPKPWEVNHDAAVRNIAKVRLPYADPVYGRSGPLLKHWGSPMEGERSTYAQGASSAP
jgi:uncharacterized protein YjlB